MQMLPEIVDSMTASGRMLPPADSLKACAVAVLQRVATQQVVEAAESHALPTFQHPRERGISTMGISREAMVSKCY